MREDAASVGLDMHKEPIAVVVTEDRRVGEMRHMGEIANTREAVRKLLAGLLKAHGTLRLCHEAGPCGYGTHPRLTEMGHPSDLVAPPMTPSRPGDSVKTDRRDAVLLARLHRAGELTAVWLPDEVNEAMRDLVRARTAAMEGLPRARQQLTVLSLCRERVSQAGCNCTKKHQVWLANLRFEHPAHQIVLQAYSDAVDDARRVLAEGAWTCRGHAAVGAVHMERLEAVTGDVRDIAWKAQIGLFARCRRLVAPGKQPTLVVTAIAGEMAALIMGHRPDRHSETPGRTGGHMLRQWRTRHRHPTSRRASMWAEPMRGSTRFLCGRRSVPDLRSPQEYGRQAQEGSTVPRYPTRASERDLASP
jgi:hypothetical protein